MTICNVTEIIEQKPLTGRLMGLDIGKKTIGIAVSNNTQSIATPLCTINRTKFSKDIAKLDKIIQDYEICGYVVGYPVNMDGTIGPSCDMVMSFADEFSKYPQFVGVNPWIALWDERLSTQTVKETVDKFVDKRKTKQTAKDKGVIDKMAAQIILQGALDYIQDRLRHAESPY